MKPKQKLRIKKMKPPEWLVLGKLKINGPGGGLAGWIQAHIPITRAERGIGKVK